MRPSFRRLHVLQKISMSLMAVLIVITFVGANLHTLLWQSSDWLVSAVLPSVVVELTNEERSEYSAKPLRRNETLDKAAKAKAEDMAEHQYFSHFSPQGVSPWYWFDQAGYVYAHAGENLAIHFTDSSEVVEAWMKSPSHKQNIVNGLYAEIGVGTAKGKYEGYDTVYVVQLFGAPGIATTNRASAGPLVNASTLEESTSDRETIVSDISTSQIVEEVTQEETQISATVEQASEEKLITPAEINSPVIVSIPEVEFDTSNAVFVETEVITTSSGLAVAEVGPLVPVHAGETLASIVTKPNTLLQYIYITLALIIVAMLSVSIVVEARRFHFHQVAYGLILLTGMSGLWYAHSLLTTGAVIV